MPQRYQNAVLPPDAWTKAAIYLHQGLVSIRRAPGLYVLITALFAAPALVAGALAALVAQPALWQQTIMLGLPWITVVLGTVVIMVAVAYQARGQSVDIGHATRLGLGWVPRYVWTNAHTSVIFWAPIALLSAVREWQIEILPISGALDTAAWAVWWLLIVGLGLYLHTRTLLAPFLAVHADLPATLAALEAWRLGGKHFALCFATLFMGSLPVGLPLALLALGVGRSLSEAAQSAMLAAAPDLLWAGIQAIRPILIAALYPLYHELWQGELTRRQEAGAPRVPALARALLALTRRLPRLGRWD